MINLENGIRRRIRCKQIIDCTGGADIADMLGLPRLCDKRTQPGSILFKMGGSHQPGREQLQSIYVHGADSSNSLTLTKANLTGRREILRKIRKTKQRLLHLQPEIAFRESYRIVGETIITHTVLSFRQVEILNFLKKRKGNFIIDNYKTRAKTAKLSITKHDRKLPNCQLQ